MGVMSEQALRLMFSFDGEHIHLEKHAILEMKAPPPDWDLTYGRPRSVRPLTGFWIELRDAAGTPVYRRYLSDPLHQYPEAPNGEGGWTRSFVDRKAGIFSVLVPVMREARLVTIIGPPFGTLTSRISPTYINGGSVCSYCTIRSRRHGSIDDFQFATQTL